jgi:hypothetical protein
VYFQRQLRQLAVKIVHVVSPNIPTKPNLLSVWHFCAAQWLFVCVAACLCHMCLARPVLSLFCVCLCFYIINSPVCDDHSTCFVFFSLSPASCLWMCVRPEQTHFHTLRSLAHSSTLISSFLLVLCCVVLCGPLVNVLSPLRQTNRRLETFVLSTF